MSFQFLEIIQAVQNLIEILFYFNSFHSEARTDITEIIFWRLHWQIYFKQIENFAKFNNFWLNTISSTTKKKYFNSSSSKLR